MSEKKRKIVDKIKSLDSGSIQNQINSRPAGRKGLIINQILLDDYLASSKLKKISILEIPLVPKGTRIAYSIKKGPKWRSGGFIISLNQKEGYLLYKSFNGALFSLQLNDSNNIINWI